MNKQQILQSVRTALEHKRDAQIRSQEAASEGATHEQARAETKWDTSGLEQSYLARGLARQVEQLASAVKSLQGFVPPSFAGQPASVGALIETEVDNSTDLFFLLEYGGGTEVEVEGRTVTVITPESPVGRALTGKSSGQSFSLGNLKGQILHVL